MDKYTPLQQFMYVSYDEVVPVDLTQVRQLQSEFNARLPTIGVVSMFALCLYRTDNWTRLLVRGTIAIASDNPKYCNRC